MQVDTLPVSPQGISMILQASLRALGNAGFSFDTRLPIPHFIRRLEDVNNGTGGIEQAAEAIRAFVEEELPPLESRAAAAALVYSSNTDVGIGNLSTQQEDVITTLVDSRFKPCRVVCVHQGAPHLLAIYNARPTNDAASAYQVFTCTSGRALGESLGESSGECSANRSTPSPES